jgi:hypothetical protein
MGELMKVIHDGVGSRPTGIVICVTDGDLEAWLLEVDNNIRGKPLSSPHDDAIIGDVGHEANEHIGR